MPEKQYFTGIDVINAPKIESLTVTDDGTYTASSDVIGYNPVVVKTNQPWQPLKDGYSNFWFELTDDTLSPWLNFSAKTESAVIDWGDGSGEVALDTLTPTHTYSKAGKYVVKVKGVTGINRTHKSPYNAPYFQSLQNVELNSEVTNINDYAFLYCIKLKNIVLNNNITFNGSAFDHVCNLLSVQGLSTTALAGYMFYHCYNLKSITIPSTVLSIGSSCFRECISLMEIHCQAQTPPTLGGEVFTAVLGNYIIYVPVGTAETYKAASGWSTYADHILEEGQTPNRMMLAKFNSAKTDEPQDDMR